MNISVGEYWRSYHLKWPSFMPTSRALGWHDLLHDEATILEIGFGHGNNINELLDAGFSNLSGYEFPEVGEMLSKCSQVQVFSSLNDAYDFPEKFDAIMMIGVASVMGSLPKLLTIADFANNKLGDGGKLMICDYAYSTRQESKYRKIESDDLGSFNLIHPDWSTYPFFHFTRENIEKIFQKELNWKHQSLPSRDGKNNHDGFNAILHY